MDTEDTLNKRKHLEQLLVTLASGLRDVRILFDQVASLVEQKPVIQEILDILLVWYRDMYIVHEQGDAGLIANSDALDRLTQAAQQLSESHIRQLFEIVYQTKLDIQRNANLQLALEVMLMSLAEVYNDRIRWRKISSNRKSI
jgi:DNA polymerase-3 subunit delta'